MLKSGSAITLVQEDLGHAMSNLKMDFTRQVFYVAGMVGQIHQRLGLMHILFKACFTAVIVMKEVQESLSQCITR